MDITRHPGPEWLELRLAGRLDTTWAEHVSQAIDSAVQAGSHQIVLNFAHVEYISSLGIRVLLTHFKRLSSVKGRLSISEPSEASLSILRATGLADILITDVGSARPAGRAPETRLVRGNATYEIFPQAVVEPLSCRAVGRPGNLVSSGYREDDCRSRTLGHGSFALGLGAFGNGFADCRDRFGEFLALGGSAIAVPTDAPDGRPDFLVEQGTLVPRVETLYALEGRGDFSMMVRFDAHTDGPGAIALSELVSMMLDTTASDIVAFAALCESEGLVGARLQRSPGSAPISFELPDVRDYLTFTTERIGVGSLALLLGVAAGISPGNAAAFLRPVAAGKPITAHVHAALFPYRPVQRGELAFAETMANLFANATPDTLLHLMPDTRPYEGVGESEFVRGAVWVGPLPDIPVDAERRP